MLLAVIYTLTAVLTAFMSNNAAAVLLAPMAIVTAAKLGGGCQAVSGRGDICRFDVLRHAGGLPDQHDGV